MKFEIENYSNSKPLKQYPYHDPQSGELIKPPTSGIKKKYRVFWKSLFYSQANYVNLQSELLVCNDNKSVKLTMQTGREEFSQIGWMNKLEEEIFSGKAWQDVSDVVKILREIQVEAIKNGLSGHHSSVAKKLSERLKWVDRLTIYGDEKYKWGNIMQNLPEGAHLIENLDDEGKTRNSWIKTL